MEVRHGYKAYNTMVLGLSWDIFLQILLHLIWTHLLHLSQQTASWLIPTGFSHTEHGKSTVWLYSVFFNSSVLNMNFQNLARFHIAKFMLREFFFLRKSIIQYYQVRIKERICCNCFFLLLLFFQSPHLQTINLNRSFFL